MAVTASNRRERIRHADGTRTDLPGAAPATGLTAIAACATGVQSLSGAARAAVYGDAMTPHAEVTIGVQSMNTNGGAVYPDPVIPGYVVEMRPQPGDDSPLRDNSTFGPFVLDAGRLDDARFELAPTASVAPIVYGAAMPHVFRPLAPLARLVANPEADGTGAAWSLTGAPTDENLLTNPSFTSNLDDWSYGSAVRVASGGADGGPFMRVTKVGVPGLMATTAQVSRNSAPGDVLSARIAVRGPAGKTARLEIDYAATSTTVTLTGAWQTISLDGAVVPPDPFGEQPALQASLRVVTSSFAVGETLDVDQAKVRAAATAGAYMDGASPNGVWYGLADRSPSYVQAVPVGAYSRVTDGTAPALGLPGAVQVHRRTGALAAGQRMSAPLGTALYASRSGRTFTVAGWVGSTYTGGGLPPVLRWVVTVLDPDVPVVGYPTVLHVMQSEPFAPPADGSYRRAAALLPLPPQSFDEDSWGRRKAYRVHLEVVDPRGATGAGTTLSVRGAHLYAGVDRGDAAGLLAVPLSARLALDVEIPGAGFTVNRVDVHGVDRLASPTSVIAVLDSLVAGSVENPVHLGSSPGRITARGPALERTHRIEVTVEEVNGGPGVYPIGVQSIMPWYELDATDDVVELTVDRSSDADPSDSTVPIGNYAATALSLTLDDADGAYGLFARSYVEVGHRVDVATGVIYTNRSEDPQGVDASTAGGTGTATWPARPGAVSAVVPTPTDGYGQLPPAAFAGEATGASSATVPLVTTAPAVEGATYRARAWVRWTTPAAPLVSFGAAFVSQATAGWSAVMVAGAVSQTPDRDGGTWWLLDLGEVEVPLGSNAVAVAVQGAGAGVVQVAAPSFERFVDGLLVEVVETAPAGVFRTTSWSGATGGAEVNVEAVDVLVSAGDGELSQAVVRNTTIETQLGSLARRYLDLGDDQVVMAAQSTPLPYAFPVERVTTQLADLAKAGVLTAFTDGLGRLVCLPRVDVSPAFDAEALDDRSLLSASAALTPDIIRNDVRVVVHPVSPSAATTTLGYAGREPLPVLPIAWEPTDADVAVPPGTTAELIVSHDFADNEVWAVTYVSPYTAPGATVSSWLTASSSGVTVTIDVYPTFARLRLSVIAGAPRPAYITRFSGIGQVLNIANTRQRYTREESVEVFGLRPVEVDVRLAQSNLLAAGVGADVLDAFSLRDPSGERWLPDLDVEVLGDPWVTIGDRVRVQDDGSGLSGEFRVLSHRYEHGVGASSSWYLRRVATGQAWFVLDSSRTDDARVLS